MKQKYITPELMVIELKVASALLEVSTDLGGYADEPGLTREYEWEEE